MGAGCSRGDSKDGAPSTPLDDMKIHVAGNFSDFFAGVKPTCIGVAPGRCEIVGNHTDYNEGYILSCAVDRYVAVAGRKAHEEASTTCRVTSEMFPGNVVVFDAKTTEKQTGDNAWANYVIGVVSELNKIEGVTVTGFDAVLVANIPAGAGVSSSAAVEMATAKMLSELFPSVKALSALDMIMAAKAAENNFVGMGCGVLDQFSSSMGRAGELIFLDCRPPLNHSYVPFEGAAFVLANTHAPHQLVDGKYDELRKACFESVDLLKEAMGVPITHLRDVDSKTLETHSGVLSKEQLNRARHIVLENERVMASVAGLKAGEIVTLGDAMSKSHDSSSNLFGNSCEQLDKMVECAQGIDGFLGGRLMGGGFGGCTINLVRDGAQEEFSKTLAEKYEAATGTKPTMLSVLPGDGAFSVVIPADDA